MRNSPESVRDTIWTFPEKSGKHPGLETPRFSFSQRLKISIENEIFERATHRGPIFCGEIETSRLKFSSEIKNFEIEIRNFDRDQTFF